MIIFDLDGTLANCDHRRHFVDELCDHPDYYRNPCESCADGSHHKIDPQIHKVTKQLWKPNWPSFYEACDKDEPIEPVIEMYQSLIFENHIRLGKEVQIWSGRSESVRVKTELWLDLHVWGSPQCVLKMRPKGYNAPDDVLKKHWLDEVVRENRTVDFVFDSDPKSIAMYRRRGIFVFDCNQTGVEF